MPKSQRIFRHSSFGIFRRAFSYITALTTSSLLILSFVLIATANYSAQSRSDAQMRTIASQMTLALDNYVSTMKETLFMLGQEASLPDIVNNVFTTANDRNRAYSSFYNHASSLLRYKNYVQLFLLLPAQRTVLSSDSVHYGVNIASLSEEGWMERVDENPIYFSCLETFSPPVPLRDALGFALVAPVSRLSDNWYSQRAYLVMTVGRINFQYAISGSAGELDGFYTLRNETGDVVYCSRPAMTSDADFRAVLARIPVREKDVEHSVDFGYGQYRTYQSSVKELAWEVLCFSNTSHMLDSDMRMVRVVVIATALCILTSALIAGLISRGMTRPIRSMAEVVRTMDKENFTPRIRDLTRDELGALGRDINDMAERIQTLIGQVYHIELLHRDAQLFALQQQINPHFLYNTLEIINSLANRGQTREIKQVVQKLTAIFRYGTKLEGGSLAPISSEVAHAENYMSIQQMRFGERLAFDSAVSPDILSLLTPRFILQPMLENAITHGVYALEDRQGVIRLTGTREGGDVCFVIEDNGGGMSAEELAALRVSALPDAPVLTPATGKVGLSNVHARIRLLYGKPYGVAVDSAPDAGTRVVIRIPAVAAEQGRTEA